MSDPFQNKIAKYVYDTLITHKTIFFKYLDQKCKILFFNSYILPIFIKMGWKIKIVYSFQIYEISDPFQNKIAKYVYDTLINHKKN